MDLLGSAADAEGAQLFLLTDLDRARGWGGVKSPAFGDAARAFEDGDAAARSVGGVDLVGFGGGGWNLVYRDGDRLILDESPRRVVGPGESVNIIADDLRIDGTLTATDRAYLAAMRSVGLRTAMLSYVERPEDVAEVRELLPDAEIVLKIESRRGLALARSSGTALGRLMAARGDLYVEVLEPHRIVGAVRELIAADPDAIVASRIFPSLATGAVPSCSDISDVAFCLSLGYRTFMLGDEVCQRRDSVIAALNLLSAVAAEMP